MALSSARFSEFHFQNSLPFCCHSSLNLLLSSKKPPAKSLWRFNFCFWSSSLRIEERVGDNEGGIRCKSSSRSDASRPDFERKYPWDEFESSDRNSHSKSSKRFGSRSERERSRVHSAPWLNKWPRAPMNDGKRTEVVTEKKIREEDQAESRYFDGDKGRNAIQRIVDRLRNLGFSDEEGDDNASSVAIPWEEQDEEEGDLGDKELSYLLKRKWTRPDQFVDVDGDNDSEMLLPWERDQESEVDEKSLKKKRVKAPSLAELTLPDTELKRLRRMGIILRERITVPKAGVTQEVLEKIQEKWRKSEIVRLKFHEFLANDMKTAHEIVERRTGGLVIWRSGSVMVVYRGSNYEWPSRLQSLNGGSISTDLLHDGDKPFVPDVVPDDKSSVDNNNTSISSAEKIKTPVMNLDHVESLSPEEAEYNSILDGLGPRFADWWGTGFFPVDADLLPQKIPGYKTPFRLLPTGMRPRLTNAEMTSLRKLARYLPCHFALGRNRNHHGLAAAVVKLWERSTVVKIAVKRGIQNTNNKIMAEELKKLTGGILLLRNKYYIVIYRGKDFVPSVVASALAERQELTKDIQDVEEKARIGTVGAVTTGAVEVQAPAGTLAEFLEAQARWGTEIPAEENERMKEAAVRAKRARAVKRIEHKLVVAQAKKQRSERLLSKVEASMVPIEPSDDQETITDEERFMFRRVGLRMKAYLPLGIRGVFDGVIENMHLHWKHRELVKLISKQKTLEFVEDTARLLEYESGGILVAIERVPKGYALIYYRGKNYRRPPSLRPRNLLTKAKALKRSVEMQRHEALSQHITELEITIEKMRLALGDSANIGNGSSQNPEELLQFGHTSQLTESEDEDLYLESDDDTDNSDDDRVYSSEI